MSRRLGRLVVASMFLMTGMFPAGCSDDDENGPAPADCVHTAPSHGALQVSVTIDQRYPSVPIIIYRGEWEDGRKEWSDTLTEKRGSYQLSSDCYYSVLALYIQNGDTLAVLDGDDIEVKSTSYSDATCYEIEDGDVDVRLPD